MAVIPHDIANLIVDELPLIRKGVIKWVKPSIPWCKACQKYHQPWSYFGGFTTLRFTQVKSSIICLDLDTVKALRVTCRAFKIDVQWMLKRCNADFMRSANLNIIKINMRFGDDEELMFLQEIDSKAEAKYKESLLNVINYNSLYPSIAYASGARTPIQYIDVFSPPFYSADFDGDSLNIGATVIEPQAENRLVRWGIKYETYKPYIHIDSDSIWITAPIYYNRLKEVKLNLFDAVAKNTTRISNNIERGNAITLAKSELKQRKQMRKLQQAQVRRSRKSRAEKNPVYVSLKACKNNRR